MFIHPTQTRSLTPREAARVQSFPDTFEFPAERTRSYAEIGNAVPPLVGKAVGLAVLDFLTQPEMADAVTASLNAHLPLSRALAITQLEEFIESTRIFSKHGGLSDICIQTSTQMQLWTTARSLALDLSAA
jgi:DNA (cytosine-5)-methyltransferase 1